MKVAFVSEQTGNTVIQCPEIGPKHTIRFVRGRFATTNKTEIKKLLSDDYARRNTSLAPGQDMEAISDYLEQENRPDVFTKEYLNEIPFDLWKTILEDTNVVDVKFPLVGVAKAALEGRPIDPQVEEIVENYKATTNGVQEVEEDKSVKQSTEKKVKVKLPKKEVSKEPEENWTSSDMTVNEAKTFLAGKEYEEVEGFMAEDESRVSLIDYWNERFPSHQVDLPE